MSSAREHLSAIAAATKRDRALIAARLGTLMPEAGDQLAALLDLSRVLASKKIPYALIGGIAVGIQSGTPRATADVDVAVATSFTREQVTSTLEEVGFVLTGTYEHSVNLRHPSGEPVQVAFDTFFDPLVTRAETIDMAGTLVYVLTKEDLIASKERAAADPARRRSKALRDLADVELLRASPQQEDGW